MVTAVSVSSVGFLSHDGTTQIKGTLWTPDAAPGAAVRGIVQLVHGMAEHSGRYDDFARFLVKHDFAVCAHDHLGHGKSAPSPDRYGCLPAEGGKAALIEDVHELRKTVAGRYARQTPYILFGHSLGSFIVRAYLARYAEGLTGAVICGTGQQPRLLSKGGNAMARWLAASRGEDAKSPLLHKRGAGAYSRKIRHARTEFDWLSTDPAVVDAYRADQQCGFMFSVGGYATLTDLTDEIASHACVAKVPPALPLLLVSGADDPVGRCGKGVRAVAKQMRRAGIAHVDVVLYEGMRHEILNEPDHERVYSEIARWIEECACGHPMS